MKGVITKKILPLLIFYTSFNSLITYAIVKNHNNKINNKSY